MVLQICDEQNKAVQKYFSESEKITLSSKRHAWVGLENRSVGVCCIWLFSSDIELHRRKPTADVS